MLKVEQVNKNHRNNYNSGDPTGQIGPLTQSSGLIIAANFPAMQVNPMLTASSIIKMNLRS